MVPKPQFSPRSFDPISPLEISIFLFTHKVEAHFWSFVKVGNDQGGSWIVYRCNLKFSTFWIKRVRTKWSHLWLDTMCEKETWNFEGRNWVKRTGGEMGFRHHFWGRSGSFPPLFGGCSENPKFWKNWKSEYLIFF